MILIMLAAAQPQAVQQPCRQCSLRRHCYYYPREKPEKLHFESFYAEELGSIQEQSVSCALCNFFWTLRIQDSPSGKYRLNGYELMPRLPFFSQQPEHDKLYREFYYQKTLIHAYVLAVVPDEWQWEPKPPSPIAMSKCIFVNLPSPPQVWGRKLGPRIDYDVLRGWMKTCSETHGPACTSSKTSARGCPYLASASSTARPVWWSPRHSARDLWH